MISISKVADLKWLAQGGELYLVFPFIKGSLFLPPPEEARLELRKEKTMSAASVTFIQASLKWLGMSQPSFKISKRFEPGKWQRHSTKQKACAFVRAKNFQPGITVTEKGYQTTLKSGAAFGAQLHQVPGLTSKNRLGCQGLEETTTLAFWVYRVLFDILPIQSKTKIRSINLFQLVKLCTAIFLSLSQQHQLFNFVATTTRTNAAECLCMKRKKKTQKNNKKSLS